MFVKYYHENQPATHFHKAVFLRNHSYTETFEDREKIYYDMFIRDALSNFLYTFVLTKRIVQRQHGVVDLLSPNTYNNTK